VDARIASSTIAGFPVTTRRRLRAVDVHRARIPPRLADGRLTMAWTDTFLVGRHDLDDLQPELLRAAAVATVEPAVLGGVSALERRTGWLRFADEIHVYSEHRHEDMPARGIWFHHLGDLRCDAFDMCRALPTATPHEALLQGARQMTPHQAANAIRELEYHCGLSLDEFESVLGSKPHVIGAPRLRRAMELRRLGSAGTKSRSEDRLLPHVVARFGEPLVNVRGAAGIPDYEPDMVWPELRLIVEVDGRHHVDDPGIRAADAERDTLLRSVGWIVVRIPWYRVWRDLPRVLREIERATRS
jgi:very-short-patch-repair endonuclease